MQVFALDTSIGASDNWLSSLESFADKKGPFLLDSLDKNWLVLHWIHLGD